MVSKVLSVIFIPQFTVRGDSATLTGIISESIIVKAYTIVELYARAKKIILDNFEIVVLSEFLGGVAGVSPAEGGVSETLWARTRGKAFPFQKIRKPLKVK
jgi:hypothetical protein